MHDDTVAPIAEPYCPASHGPAHKELDRPSASPYKPAAQLVHDPEPATLYVPVGQIHTVAFVDPAGHSYPALHSPEHDALVSPVVLP